MSRHPEPRPEGVLIKGALKRSGMSARKAAELAGISEGRWRQIMNGYQTVTRGQDVEVEGPAETVARMALVVGVIPAELEGAGRADAAEILRAMDQVAPSSAEWEPWRRRNFELALEGLSPDEAEAFVAEVMDAQRRRRSTPSRDVGEDRAIS